MLLLAFRCGAEQLNVLAADTRGLTIEFLQESAPPDERFVDGEIYHQLKTELPLPVAVGVPALPFVAELIAVPAGATVSLEVLEAHYVDYEQIDLLPVQSEDREAEESEVFWRNPQAYRRNSFEPADQATLGFMGIQRGVRVHRLHLYPWAYNPVRQILRVFDRLRVRIRFVGVVQTKPVKPDRIPFSSFYNHFLNPVSPSIRQLVSKPTRNEWYDSRLPWIKLVVDRDELFRVDRFFLVTLGIDTDDVDPRTLRLFHRGKEQIIYLAGEEDGRFDADDFLLFNGRFRRDDRDIDSIFGRQNTYWLTWGGASGQRFVAQSGAPVNQFPQSSYFWSTAHFEQDLWYDPLPDAPDNTRDHWFWDQPVLATKPDVPSSRIFARDLSYPALAEEYTARFRVSLHGTTNLGHHTVVKLNNNEIDNAIWDGQVARSFEREIPSTYLRDGTNRVLLQVFADQAKWDQVFFNWFAVDYRRLYKALVGHLSFSRPPTPTGERITISGFRYRAIELFDVANGVRYTDLVVDSTETGISATFEHRSSSAPTFVIADSSRILTPTGILDTLSTWGSPDQGADYLIITHPSFAASAERLARHRHKEGLRVSVVHTTDIYDEFSHGLLDRAALKEFLQYAYNAWQVKPIYLLLLGDATFDYRNIFGGGAPSFVPSLYYHARNRGHAPSDVQYGFLEGEDILPDIAVGRLAVATPEEAAAAVDKIIRYDVAPAPGPWRRRVVYAANYHPKALFTGPSDHLAERYTEPLGLQSIKVYNEDNTPIPNTAGRRFLDALNDGALLFNFNGHGSAGTMQFLFSLQFPDWDYLSQVSNGPRLPLVLALSCLNGMFANPHEESLGEVFTDKADGGSIAYISASAESFVAQNGLLGENLFSQLFERGNLEFGPSLNAAKTLVLAAHPSFKEAVLTMQLFGDPAQELALQEAPDFAAEELIVEEETLFAGATASIRATLGNYSIHTADSVDVLILAHHPRRALPDTLHQIRTEGFMDDLTLSLPWAIGSDTGVYLLELRLDPEGRINDTARFNNNRELRVEVLEPLLPELAAPRAHEAVAGDDLKLTAMVPIDAGTLSCQFALSTEPMFDSTATIYSPEILSQDGLAVYEPPTGAAGLGSTYFWRARIVLHGAVGPWSDARTFTLSKVNNVRRWRQVGRQFVVADTGALRLNEESDLVLGSKKEPIRLTEERREDWFRVADIDGAGLVCADGTYLYTKRWFNDPSTIYPGQDRFTKIGTGFNGSTPGRVYGVLSDSTTAGISATYHSDGFIYNESGRAFELERSDVSNGKMDTVVVRAGLVEWKYGHVEDGHSLITSDGNYIYNVSMSSEAGTRNEWRVRIFDPANGWELLREFTSPPTKTGFTYKWTDGILADTEDLYLLEFGGDNRVRRIDTVDGAVRDEVPGDQDTTRIVAGQYDWVNNKVWLGDLFGPTIYRYAGGDRVEAASLLSPVIGPAFRWQTLETAGSTDGPESLRIELLGGSDADSSWVVLEGFERLALGQTIDLGSIDASTHRSLRLRAHFSRVGAALLSQWSVRFTPLPSLQIVGTEGRVDSLLHVAASVRFVEPPTDGEVVLNLEDTQGKVLATHTITEYPDLGTIAVIQLKNLPLPVPGEKRFVRLTSDQPDADPRDNIREVILPWADVATPLVTVAPSGRPFADGDFLSSNESLWIQIHSGPETVELLLDGVVVEPDSVRDAADNGKRFLIRPASTFGRHELLIKVADRSGKQREWHIAFQVRAKLAIARALVYPHPVRDTTDFTFSLSQDATVTVDVFSLSGRLVRRLSARDCMAGFCSVFWNGRDEDGRKVANGSYLYRIQAANNNEEVLLRGSLTVLR